MVIRKARPETDQLARSLLQKAVRRGDARVVTSTFKYLVEKRNDLAWLRSRLAVVTFEEVWPYGANVTFDAHESEILHHYVALCRQVKNKDAAGLGSLGYALATGDVSVLGSTEHDWFIRVIAKALNARDDFWRWALEEAGTSTSDVQVLVSRAHAGFKRAGWLWDKAFACAAALLGVRGGLPQSSEEVALSSPAEPFPCWIAIDKHTARGKSVIYEIAREKGLNPSIVAWLSFYLESAVCDRSTFSPWWEKEKTWRIHKLGLDMPAAKAMWDELRPVIANRLSQDATQLADAIAEFRNDSEAQADSCYAAHSGDVQQQLF